ncbi:hypothetical protein BAE36_22190 [Rhizobium leguminosarum bv. trifolii]|uniref:XRE family transcriptional regulator n=1 Tax=Rhizobium leguminosarum bv. trifolii TaxID=386 RepID=A0A1B8R8G0_RHILT|nr:hypothetical protein [Rhizobium leguminosarum]AOO92158.1 hypothetical protein [Rhizobium leguminosarum bv. trifolii]OBY05061.1 hypothetical protein BAE36_22190 [Rhizobium leguminosarum bv. trifolii]TBY18805.1 hypothetical protein E0H30_21295 [Rhizobium leguminosarum bv. viciae]TBY27025.1 hypothetical protein E0H37_18605 [Rhizobium leguminosarum bv. viciae]TBZ02048.1 hypothetical protein E0H49_10560 [Rhizobium leguminosarum bv. viciae]
MNSESNSEVAKFIQAHLEISPYTVEEITLLLGFRSPDMVEGFLRGERKVPLDKVLPLADALGCDKRQLFESVLRSWFDIEFLDAIKEIFAGGSSTEQEWISFLRELYGENIPELTPALRRRLRLFASVPS